MRDQGTLLETYFSSVTRDVEATRAVQHHHRRVVAVMVSVALSATVGALVYGLVF